MADAVQISKNHADGSTHAVGFGDLRVMILEEDGIWYAQGMEVDYIAEGSSLEAAQKAFEEGLALTIAANLKHCGNIEDLLQPASAEVWAEFYQQDSGRYLYSTVSTHVIDQQFEEVLMVATTNAQAKPAAVTRLPFNRINYLAAQAA